MKSCSLECSIPYVFISSRLLFVHYYRHFKDSMRARQISHQHTNMIPLVMTMTQGRSIALLHGQTGCCGESRMPLKVNLHLYLHRPFRPVASYDFQPWVKAVFYQYGAIKTILAIDFRRSQHSGLSLISTLFMPMASFPIHGDFVKSPQLNRIELLFEWQHKSALTLL